MARKRRIYYDKSVHHICIRGNNRQRVLGNSKDKKMFLECLKKFKLRFGFKLYGFVIMDNHVHLIIETNGKINISKIMQAITLSFSVRFRKKYPYTGYVWQGRFASNLIEDQAYIIQCIEYIHNNPVRSEIVKKPGDYRWSSYNFYNNYKQDFVPIDRLEL